MRCESVFSAVRLTTSRAVECRITSSSIRPLLASVAPAARRPAAEADTGRPTVTEKKQGLEESPQEAQRKWEEQMRRLGVDPNQYKVKK